MAILKPPTGILASQCYAEDDAPWQRSPGLDSLSTSLMYLQVPTRYLPLLGFADFISFLVSSETASASDKALIEGDASLSVDRQTVLTSMHEGGPKAGFFLIEDGLKL